MNIMNRSIIRTTLISLSLISFYFAGRIFFTPFSDTSDTGGGALGYALAYLSLTFLGILLFAIGSVVPGDDPTRLPTIPSLDSSQLLLVRAAIAILIIGVPLAIVSGRPGLMFLGGLIAIMVLLLAWLWRVTQGLRKRLTYFRST